MRTRWLKPDPARIAAALLCAAGSMLGVGARAQDAAPLPDAEPFLADVRANLQLDTDVPDGYTFLERRVEADISFFGGVKEEGPKLYRVYRSAELGIAYRRLLEEEGEPLSDEELTEQDRRHRAERLKAARDRARESERDREKRQREDAEDAEEEREMMEEVLGLFEYRLEGRDRIDGRSTIVVSFVPRAEVDPKTRPGKILAKSIGRAWVSEDDRQVIRIEAEAMSDITIGWGLVARLHKGSRIDVRRTRVSDRWLPARFDFTGSGRTLLFRTFAVELTTEIADYEPLTADLLPYEPIKLSDAGTGPR
ncbi:MAG: hypothetical protein QGG24_02290 [Vicinamibacterales bacterium]|jgi:hypothetical protein|nr:hypothetical protein [Vicinamibacterales bacterium]MDP7471701.1 hypothetical protein [Vicinamibacterales bacterium]MDP7671611.1 hypothetical protein [Vicinamibacterales bacterium]HJO37057.1 hypothetical protein [Vicinamibacterales bacterium]|tara:strand:- start:1733 stop:2659 length:927 start_codon:yes stop_codon:yes gene_type:complete